MDPFLKLHINQTLDRIQTESHEAYMHRLDILKAVAKWNEVKYRESGDARSQAEARTRLRLVNEALEAAVMAAYESEDYEPEEVDDSVSIHDPVFYG